MPLKDRAKQFMPFDALRGLQDALRLKEYKHERIEMGDLSEETIQEISNTLSSLKKYDSVEIKIYDDGHIKTYSGKVVLKFEENKIIVDDIVFDLNSLIYIKLLDSQIQFWLL